MKNIQAKKSCWGASYGQNVDIVKILASRNAPSFVVQIAEKLNSKKQ